MVEGARALYSQVQWRQFIDVLKVDYHKFIEEEVEHNFPHTIFGPEFALKTTAGEGISISSIILNLGQARGRYKSWLLLALDKSRKIVGIRSTDLYREGLYHEAKGAITVADRGRGIATCLEMVNLFLLRHEAHTTGEIYWRRQDGNIYFTRSMNDLTKDRNDKDIKSIAEQERQRWLALYGPQGKLGFSESGVLIITKTVMPTEYDLDVTDFISLKSERIRLGDREALKPVKTSQKISHNADQSQRKKKQNFLSSLLPQIRRMIV